MHPPHPPPAIFKHIFGEHNFSIISNLFDNNKPYALSTHNRKCSLRTKCIIFGAILRIRGKKFKQNLPKICSNHSKMATTVCTFSKIFPGSMPPDPLEPFSFSICFAERVRLKICQNWVPPSQKKFLNSPQT